MQMRTQTVAFLTVCVALSLFGARAADRQYHSNVSDIEVEESVKGETYNQGPKSYFGNSKKNNCSQCCTECAAPLVSAPATTTTTTTTATTTTTTAPATGETRQIKYILDGKPVYQDGAKGESGNPGIEGPAGAVPAPVAAKIEPAKEPRVCTESEIKTWIAMQGTAGWRDAQARIIEAGKCSIPVLIEALGQTNAVAYNLVGHTKADLGRAPRQLTIAQVCAELLAEIVGNHSTYKEELPGSTQREWQDWWDKNAASVTFAN